MCFDTPTDIQVNKHKPREPVLRLPHRSSFICSFIFLGEADVRLLCERVDEKLAGVEYGKAWRKRPAYCLHATFPQAVVEGAASM